MQDFPHRPFGTGRAYRVTDSLELVAFHVEAPMPHAPCGFLVYTFVEKGRRVGTWDWARDEAGVEAVAQAYRDAVEPSDAPPPWIAPGGEPAVIRPTDRDGVARAMDAARPGPEAVVPRGLCLVPRHADG